MGYLFMAIALFAGAVKGDASETSLVNAVEYAAKLV